MTDRHEKMVNAATWLAEQGIARIGWAAVGEGKAAGSRTGHRWQDDATDDPAAIRTMLTGGRNSLVIPKERGLLIDNDDAAAWSELAAAGLPPTFTVDTPTPGHGHVYGMVPVGIDMSTIPGTFEYGELRRFDPRTSTSSMVLGPWAQLPDGRLYRPRNGVRQVATLPRSVIQYLVESDRRKRSAEGTAKGPTDDGWFIEKGRHDYLVRRARHLRGVGLTGARLLEELKRLDAERCRPPLASDPARGPAEIERIAGWTEGRIGDDPPELATAPDFTDPTITIGDFVARRDESAAEALISSDYGTIMPAGGFGLVVGKTSDGKTTLLIDLLLHAVAGRDYLHLRFPRPLRVLVIQNEGPREAFRLKIEERLRHWDGPTDGLRIWDDPATWGAVQVSVPEARTRLKRVTELHETDLVLSDTLTRFGVRGNGSPDETREFVGWLTEVGLGRDLGFLLLHHLLTRPDPALGELEQIAGAWAPHADMILLTRRELNNRARLSAPKLRWARAAVPPAILAFEPETESFTFAAWETEQEERDYISDLKAFMVNGEWYSAAALAQKKADGGIGASRARVDQALHDDAFESAVGAVIGKKKSTVYYRLRTDLYRADPSNSSAQNDGPPSGEEARTVPRSPLYKKGTRTDSSSSDGRNVLSGAEDANTSPATEPEDLVSAARRIFDDDIATEATT